MAQDTPPEDLMEYGAMAQEALRGVIKAALRKVTGGMPGDHHFYITFKTQAPGVEGPADLLSKYPDEMTVVLKQDQYRDLAPGETFFSVVLSFGGQPKRLSIPYAAISHFKDPTAQFLLQFEVVDAEPEAEPEPEAAIEQTAETPPAGPKVVSLDQFRKK